MTPDDDPKVLEVHPPEVIRRWFGWGRSEYRVPPPIPGARWLRWALDPDGGRRAVPLDEGLDRDAVGRGEPTDLLLSVSAEVPELRLDWARLLREPDGDHDWDLSVRGALRVTGWELFAAAVRPMAAWGAPLRRSALAAWLAEAVRIRLGDALRDLLGRAEEGGRGKETFAGLLDATVSPPSWWQQLLEPALASFGLALTVRTVAWDSPEARRAATARRERELQARTEAQRAAELAARRRADDEELREWTEAARRKARAEAELEALRHELEARRTEWEAERKVREADGRLQETALEWRLRAWVEEEEGRLRQAERRRVEGQLEDERRLQALRQTAARDALQHELELARLRHEAETERARCDDERRVALAEAARLAAIREAESSARLASLRAEMDRLRSEGERRSMEASAARVRIEHEYEQAAVTREHARLALEREQAALERARWEAEKARREAEEAGHRADEAKSARERTEAVLREEPARRRALEGVLAEQTQVLEAIARLQRELFQSLESTVLAALASGVPGQAYEAGARLAAAGYASGDLARAGWVTPQAALDRFRGLGVTLRKRQVVPKTLGLRALGLRLEPRAGAARIAIDTLQVGESAAFEWSSSRAGHLVLINVGTSGDLVLLCPNHFRPAVPIVSGRTYAMPGPETLPPAELERLRMDFRELGPEGWEYLLAIVSPEPVVAPEWLLGRSPGDPFARLRWSDLDALWQRLARPGNAGWVSGVLGYRVEEPGR